MKDTEKGLDIRGGGKGAEKKEITFLFKHSAGVFVIMLVVGSAPSSLTLHSGTGKLIRYQFVCFFKSKPPILTLLPRF